MQIANCHCPSCMACYTYYLPKIPEYISTLNLLNIKIALPLDELKTTPTTINNIGTSKENI